jgi:hypothetical protein
MFGESPGEHRGEFQALEVVTICDHLEFLGLGQLKEEIGGEPGFIAFDSLVEDFGGHGVKLGQIGIKHHFFTPQSENPGCDPFLDKGFWLRIHIQVLSG